MDEHTGCALAIVGSRDAASYQIESLIRAAIHEHNPRMVVSGGAVGVDTAAREIAFALGIPVMEVQSSAKRWDFDPGSYPVSYTETVTDYGMLIVVHGGFKQRDEKIAEMCDCLVRIASATTTTYGSGWTADRAEQLGKHVVRHTV